MMVQLTAAAMAARWRTMLAHRDGRWRVCLFVLAWHVRVTCVTACGLWCLTALYIYGKCTNMRLPACREMSCVPGLMLAAAQPGPVRHRGGCGLTAAWLR
jgi:hypothetical protein